MFKNLCEIFETKTINKELVNKIYKVSNNSNTPKLFAKKYLIEFLIDINDNFVSINKEEDFWFDKVGNKEKASLIKKYIELVIGYIKKDSKDFENLEIIKIISEFLDTSISKLIVLFYLIINKCYLPQTIMIQFIGFILGEDQKFIKNNYLTSLKSLLNLAKIEIDDISSNIPLYEINEKLLETINIYFYLYPKNINDKLYEEENEEEEEDEEDYIEIIKNKDDDNLLTVLYESLLDKTSFTKLNLTYFYKKIFNDKELDLLFSYENGSNHSTENILFRNKIDTLKNDIILNIEKYDNYNLNNFYFENNNKIKKENKNFINDKNGKVKDIEDNQIILEIKKDKDNQKNNEEIKNDNINKNKKSNSSSDENINIDNNNKDFVDITNKNSKNDKVQFSKLCKINDFKNYPSLEYLMSSNDNNNKNKSQGMDNKTNFFLLEAILFLNEKAAKIENYLDNAIFDLKNLNEKINLDININNLEIINSQLEILIDFLKAPNFHLIKRKIVEGLLFELYKSKKTEFKIPPSYKPNKSNLDELVNLIKQKSDKDKENSKILKDMEKFENIINSLKHENKEEKTQSINNNGEEEKNEKEYNLYENPTQSIIIKEYLEFIKEKSNPYINILNKDKSQFYSIPGLFNDNIKENKYFSDINVFRANDDNFEINSNNNNFDKNNRYLNEEFFNKNKFIDYAFGIIFSQYSELNYLDDNFFNALKEKANIYKEEISEIVGKYELLFKFNKVQEKSYYYGEDLEKVKNISNKFITEVIESLDEFYDFILNEKDLKKYSDLIIKINSFLNLYINNCFYSFKGLYNIIQKNAEAVYLFIMSKIYILENLQGILEKQKLKFDNILDKQKRKYISNSNNIINNLKKLKKLLNQQNYQENYYEWIYLEKAKWKDNFISNRNLFEINSMKNALRNIAKNISLEMNYTFDNLFCLWSIQNGFEEYFY